jgi:ABC-type multidrug transport system ATPase subunit
MAEPIVDVVGIAKHYPGGGGVSGVTLRLERGDLIGLVGANGGGKTTTLRMLGGLLTPDAGSGCVLDRDVRHGRPDRRRTGYMGQRLSLYPDLTAAENLHFHAAAHGLPRGAVDAAMTRFGNLSGGWARRVQFAASLIHGPPLILLDEPTAGLDAITRRQLWTWLVDLAGEGHTIVISTHDLAEAAALPAIALFHGGAAQPVMSPAAVLMKTGTTSLEEAVVRVASK